MAASIASSAALALAPARAPADLVLTDARIYTEDAAHTTARSLAVSGGRISFVGSAAEAKAFVGPHTRVVRAGGRLVLPGLVDAHLHPTLTVDFDVCSLDAQALSLAQIGRKVRGCIESRKPPQGEWVYVTLWEYGAGNDPDPAHPTLRRALDAAAPHNPVYMIGWDGHHAAYNSEALARAKNAKGETVGYSKATLAGDFSSYAGYIGVDANGEPSGNVNDQARNFIDTSEINRGQHAKLLQEPERITALLNSRGITAAQDAWAHPSDFEIYDRLIAKGRLTVWLNMAQFHNPEDFRTADGRVDYDRLFARADEIRAKYAGNPLTRADAVKVFADGVTEGNPNTKPPTLGDSPRPTPYLQPIFGRDGDNHLTVTGYADPGSPQCIYARSKPEVYASPRQIEQFIERYGFHPGQCAISYGVPAMDPTVFAEYIKQAHVHDYTIHIHAISDAAVTMAIDALEAARAADGKSSRPDTLAHIEFATPADVARMGKDHLYLAYTYSWAYADPTGYDMSLVPFYDHVLGNSYAEFHKKDSYFERTYYPFETSKTAGAILVAGSDAPVLTKDPQPFVNMEYAMTRAKRGMPPTSPWQRLSIAEVLDAYTIDGARALGREADIGSLEVGKSADFIVLDRDVVALGESHQPEQVGDAHVKQTWFRGIEVYRDRAR